MKLKGINYDIGIQFFYGNPESINNVWDKEIFKRELAIIRDELGCNAIRLSGTDEDDMICGTEMVLQAGMDCWVSPHYIDAPLDELERRTKAVAAGAEPLRAKYPNNEVVFIYGCELQHFSPFLPGNNFGERLALIMTPEWPKLLAEATEKLGKFFEKVIPGIREVFGGRVTYTTVTLEPIDWTPFDIVGLDAYKNTNTIPAFMKDLKSYKKIADEQNKEFYCLETGYGCFAECRDVAGANNMSLDLTPEGVLNRVAVRDEKAQADALVDAMEDILSVGACGIFPFTFINGKLTHSEDPLHDLDMIGYSIVKTYEDGRAGSVFEGVNWDPKEVFYALKEFYKTH